MSIDRQRILAARDAIDPVFLDSPVVSSGVLDDLLGCRCVLKVETLNPIRSFKGRGTEAVMESLRPAPQRVVTTSSGNFGQGMARAGVRRGIAVTVFSSVDDNPGKLAAMRRLGADVQLVARGLVGRDLALAEAARTGATFIEDGAHEEIAAGAGTLAVELLQQTGGLDAILVQIGDGALVTGVGSWIKETAPQTRVLGVCAAGSPAMLASIEAKKRLTLPANTIADGMAIDEPVESAAETIAALADGFVVVDDAALITAMGVLLRDAGIVAEPSGAAGIAAILKEPERFRRQSVGVIVTGSNVLPELLRQATS